ncbi:MAG TPA: tyrosine-type recombinase/integrase [Bryobacteraceae bacterium]|nr:tyrosine-type recombinase/integrase [Bryobacteraceae bacterium]
MQLQPISDQQRETLFAKVRGMPRNRHQHGRVEPVGKTEKKWRGHYYVYLLENGKERRAHKVVVLGLRSELTKGRAEAKLRDIIVQATSQPSRSEATLKWFWEHRFVPLREPTWKESSRSELISNVDRYVVRQLGETLLSKLDKFTCQCHINTLAEKYSYSVVEKARVWLRAILEEAVDQEYIAKNPARKLIMPVSRKESTRILTVEEVESLVSHMPGRFQLVPLCCVVLGLRAGEVLALRWNDIQNGTVRIDEGMRYGKIYSPKTATSNATVCLPSWLEEALCDLRRTSKHAGEEAFIFPNSKGGVWGLTNFRNRVLKTAIERMNSARLADGLPEIKDITFQAMRRTTGTMLNAVGNIKDVQAHLRHAQASTTLGIYVKAIPESVRDAVERLGANFRPAARDCE